MSGLTKRQKTFDEKIDRNRHYVADDALELVKSCATAKFPESVDVAICLGLDTRKSDQMIRGALQLPNGTGKSVRVAVFAQGDKAAEAKTAGADVIGFDDLAQEIKKGNFDFDVLIATPDAMPQVGKLGPILGPRGLMPNPKVGTVTADIATAVKNVKSGQVQYRTDKAGVVHCPIGKAEFTVEQLKKNLEAVISEVKRVKPTGARGTYITKITVSSTMGPGLLIENASVGA